MPTELPLTGRCLCGGVCYEVDEPLMSASYCHCTRCQRRTGGGASAQARVADGSLRVVAGAALVSEWVPPETRREDATALSRGSMQMTISGFSVDTGLTQPEPPPVN